MIRKLFIFLGDYRKNILICVAMASIDVVGTMLMPMCMSKIVDVGVAGRDVAYIGRVGLLMVGMALLSMSAGILNMRSSAKASQGFAANLRGSLFDKIQQFSFSNIDRFSAPSLVTRLTSDVNQLQVTVLMGLRMLLRAPLMLVSAACFAVGINARLSLVVLAAILILAAGIALVLKAAELLFRVMQERVDNLNGTVQENLIAIRTVKAFVRGAQESSKFRKSNDDLMRAGMNAGNVISSIMPLMMLVMNGALIAVIWFGGRMVSVGSLSTGQLISFISYLSEILFSVMIFSMVFVLLARAEACARRVVEVLDTRIDIVDKPGSAPEAGPFVGRGEIEFRGVDFKYEASGSGEKILSAVSLRIEPGEFVAIVGGTGSGKTSLVNLVPRLYDATAGQVLVDGVDVRDYPLKNLRAGIGMVLQKNVLFSGTIRENLLWGDEKADDAAVAEAAGSAQADEFIRSFPDGYGTELGQGGVNVSGGQKQRLCIARAMLKRPAILILDDSTSAVDTATEALIREAFHERLRGTTVLMVAQRVGSVKAADRIVVMDDGRIAGVGTHDELLRDNRIYREICLSQQEGLAS